MKDLVQQMAGVVRTDALPHASANNGTITTVLGIVFAFTASIALLMIVIGGFRYVTAQGDPNGTAQAKNTIIYAVIGLLVSMVAFSIVTFVIKGIS
jgi:hypothetical protein